MKDTFSSLSLSPWEKIGFWGNGQLFQTETESQREKRAILIRSKQDILLRDLRRIPQPFYAREKTRERKNSCSLCAVCWTKMGRIKITGRTYKRHRRSRLVPTSKCRLFLLHLRLPLNFLRCLHLSFSRPELRAKEL